MPPLLMMPMLRLLDDYAADRYCWLRHADYASQPLADGHYAAALRCLFLQASRHATLGEPSYAAAPLLILPSAITMAAAIDTLLLAKEK